MYSNQVLLISEHQRLICVANNKHQLLLNIITLSTCRRWARDARFTASKCGACPSRVTASNVLLQPPQHDVTQPLTWVPILTQNILHLYKLL